MTDCIQSSSVSVGTIRKMTKPRHSSQDPPVEPQVEAAEQTEVVDVTEKSAEEVRIAELESQLQNAKEDLLRALADAQTFRRRARQEVEQAYSIGAAELATKLLPVLDNFERTLSAAESGASSEALIEGVRLVEKSLRSALEEYGIEPIPAVGSRFDPKLHEAVASVESEAEEGAILEEIEKGYRMGDKVLRPTKARVSKGSSHKALQ